MLSITINSSVFEQKFKSFLQDVIQEKNLEKVADETIEYSKRIVHDYEPGKKSKMFWDASGNQQHTDNTSVYDNLDWETYRENQGQSQPVPGRLRDSLSWSIVEQAGNSKTVGVFNTALMPQYWAFQENGGYFEYTGFDGLKHAVYIQPKNYIKVPINNIDNIFNPIVEESISELLSKYYGR